MDASGRNRGDRAAIILGLFEFVLRNELFRGLLTNLVLGAIRG